MEITPMTRKQKKAQADKKREKFRNLALLIILKSIEEYQKETGTEFTHAFDNILNQIPLMESVWIKREPQDAHFIRSGIIAAKKEIDQMIKNIHKK